MKGISRISLAVAVLAVAAAPVAPAGGRQQAVSAVTLKVAGGPPFHGRVTSESPACIANRKVLLLEARPEQGPIDFADNRTNGKGKRVFSSQLQGATVVRAKVARSKSSGVICRSALSRAKRLRQSARGVFVRRTRLRPGRPARPRPPSRPVGRGWRP